MTSPVPDERSHTRVSRVSASVLRVSRVSSTVLRVSRVSASVNTRNTRKHCAYTRVPLYRGSTCSGGAAAHEGGGAADVGLSVVPVGCENVV